MKVESDRRVPAEKPRAEFKETLEAAKPKPPPLPVRGVPVPIATTGPKLAFAEARAHANKVAEVRALARTGMDAKVEKAHEVRADGVGRTEAKVEAKALELIAKELKDERPEPAPPAGELKPAQVIHFERRATQHTDASPQQSREAKVDGILALVEKIRIFERQGRPAMAISVGGSLDAHVEIERAGHRLVTLKVVGKSKIPSAARLNEIRDELNRRGIKVASLSISAGAPSELSRSL